MSEVYKTEHVELRLGRWQDVLSDVTCDALIVDAPYSERTHKGHNSAASSCVDAGTYCAELSYGCWSADDVARFVAHWGPRTRGWFVSLTDHVLISAWESELEKQGLYVFSPLACVVPGSRVRRCGDGPSQWSTFAVVARPRAPTFLKWGTLNGAHIQPAGQYREQFVTGGKPLWLMQALIRDYTRPGDLVCDPCAGGATTLLAAAIEGRRAIGAECMPEHFAIGKKRLQKGFTPSMFTPHNERPKAEQTDLFHTEEKVS